jgi:serine/threonine protein kinase
MKDIDNEIRLMISLDQVDGVCQLIGIFDDTPSGVMPDKYSNYCDSYPVIVMEMLQGGDLFARISTRTKVTENFLAVTFISMVRALQSLHARNFIHRDLKLGSSLSCSYPIPAASCWLLYEI